MKDIADSIGVSRATVSAVLNDKPGVSAKMRKRVLEAVRGLDVPPRLVSRTMLAEFAKLVGVLVRDVTNPYFNGVVQGASDVLMSHGYHAIQQADFHIEEHADTFEAFGAFRLTGYLVSPFGKGAALEFIERTVKQGTPVVSFGGAIPGLETHVVAVDEYDGSYTATEYVIGKGHRRIAFLSGGLPWSAERIRGYMECMLKHGIDQNRVESAGDKMEDGYNGALRLLGDLANRPTAIICFNDVLALGAYRAAYELGLEIPKDLSVMGFDGIAFGEYTSPPLTTISYSPYAIGKRAAEVLLAALNGQYSNGCHREVIRGQLSVGGSVDVLGVA